MAKQSQKSKDNITEIPHAINIIKQIYPNIKIKKKRGLEMLLKKKSLKITFKTFYCWAISNIECLHILCFV